MDEKERYKMINSPTLINTIQMALETTQIINNILADETLTYKERYELIDEVLYGQNNQKS